MPGRLTGMLRRFLEIFTAPSPASPIPPVRPARVPIQVAPDRPLSSGAPLPVYPPIDIGIPVVGPAELVATQDVLVQRLRRHLALPAERFEEGYLEPIYRVAALVGLLPATRAEHHSGQGGLFRLALETGFAAARASDGVIFSAATAVDRRRKVEVAWRRAAFLGGLAVELHRPLTDMVVVAEDGSTWSPYMGALQDWAQQVGTGRVFVRWAVRAVRPQGAQTSALWVMPAVVGPKSMAELHDADPSISQVLAAVCAGVADKIHEHQLARVVRTSLEAVRAKDLALQPSLYGNLTQGAHLEPWLLDAMRALIHRGTWRFNTKGSALLLSVDGLFLRWPQCSVDLHRELTSRGAQGVPAHEATLADLLLNAGIVARSPSNDAIWEAQFADEDERVTTLRLVRPEVLLGALDDATSVQPLGRRLPSPPSFPDAAAGTGPASGSPRAPLVVPIVQLVPQSPAPTPTSSESAGVTGSPTPVDAAEVPVQAESVPRALTGDIAPVDMQEAGKPERGKPARKPRKPGAPINAEESVSSGGGHQLDAELAKMLGSPAVAGLVAEWVDHWNSGVKRHCFERTADGLALRLDIVNGSGVAAPEIFKALRENGWIKLFEQEGGRRLPVSKIEFTAGAKPETTHAFVLTDAFARHAGFVL